LRTSVTRYPIAQEDSGMVVLLVGPSGVGKSTLGEYAGQKVANCQFRDLDRLVEERTGCSASKLLPDIGNDAFLALCCKEVEALCAGCVDELCIVVVGSGALQSSHAPEWLRQHLTLAITAPAEEVYKRGGKRNRARTCTEFEQTEYSPRRIEIYDSADYKLPVDGLSEQEAKDRFLELIESLKTRLRSDRSRGRRS
jgi:shikimate kinase